MTVMKAQVMVVATESPMRSLKMSHASSLVSASLVVSAARMDPEEKGVLSADVSVSLDTNYYILLQYENGLHTIE